MQISYNWLKDYCNHELSAYELAEQLSHAGLCVETCEPRDGDWMLDVEVTSNRPDCLSHLGLAREVAALTGKKVRTPQSDMKNDRGMRFSEQTNVEVHCPELCPHYTAVTIKNVEIGQSPSWMQKRLITCGLRPVNNVVDITNYVLLESGQPMHTFDLERLQEQRIEVRRAKENENITTIDGTRCELSKNICVIADAAGPVAVAGIMGGVESGINENTTSVLLESARFNPPNIRRTSRSLGLASDSSYRFERGVDPENVLAASRRATELISELAGGEPVGEPVSLRADSPACAEVMMRFARLQKVLGIKVEKKKITGIFEGLDLEVIDCSQNRVKVRIPGRRPDLSREIDLIEEVARIHGYDKIPETTTIPVTIAPLSKHEKCERKVKKMLAGQGFDEVITCSLVSDNTSQLVQPWHNGKPIALRNPVSSDKTHLRLTLIGNLLEAKRYNNAHKIPCVDLFEAGKIYLPQGENTDDQPEEKRCLSIITDRKDGFFVLKGILQNICSTLYLPESWLGESTEQLASLANGRSLHLHLGDQFLGFMGEIDPQWAADMDFPAAPAVLELDFDLLLEHASIEPKLRPLPKYPAVTRDIAIVVDEKVRWTDIEACVRSIATEEFEKIDFFDIYRGKQVPKDRKSVAFSITLRSPERTLKNEEADRFRDAAVAALADKYGAELRE